MKASTKYRKNGRKIDLEKTKIALENKITESHDFQQVGLIWQWDACGRKGTARCTICGLTCNWFRGGQNYPDSQDWQDARGNLLTLAEAASTGCGKAVIDAKR